jgi:hypothetical protein
MYAGATNHDRGALTEKMKGCVEFGKPQTEFERCAGDWESVGGGHSYRQIFR